MLATETGTRSLSVLLFKSALPFSAAAGLADSLPNAMEPTCKKKIPLLI
jgi:hypothetical protein